MRPGTTARKATPLGCGSFGVRLLSQEGSRVRAGGFPHLGELTGLYDDNPPSCDNAPPGTRKPSTERTRTLPDTTTLLPEDENPPGHRSTRLAHPKIAAPTPLGLGRSSWPGLWHPLCRMCSTAWSQRSRTSLADGEHVDRHHLYLLMMCRRGLTRSTVTGLPGWQPWVLDLGNVAPAVGAGPVDIGDPVDPG